MAARSGDASASALWKMRTMILWFTVASLVCTAVMYVAVGPWLESNIRRGLESFYPKKIEVRARHQPPWRERPDRDDRVSPDCPFGLGDCAGFSICFFRLDWNLEV